VLQSARREAVRKVEKHVRFFQCRSAMHAMSYRASIHKADAADEFTQLLAGPGSRNCLQPLPA